MSHYQCSTCGIILGAGGKPVKEYPRNLVIYACVYICEKCRSEGKTLDTPIKQEIPEWWEKQEALQGLAPQTPSPDLEEKVHFIIDEYLNKERENREKRDHNTTD